MKNPFLASLNKHGGMNLTRDKYKNIVDITKKIINHQSMPLKLKSNYMIVFHVSRQYWNTIIFT